MENIRARIKSAYISLIVTNELFNHIRENLEDITMLLNTPVQGQESKFSCIRDNVAYAEQYRQLALALIKSVEKDIHYSLIKIGRLGKQDLATSEPQTVETE